MKREYIEPGIEITYFVTESVMEGEPNIMLLSLNDPTVDPTDMGGTETVSYTHLRCNPYIHTSAAQDVIGVRAAAAVKYETNAYHN